MFEEFATVCLLVMGFLGVGEVGGFILLARIFCCKTVLFLPFRVSFYRQQRSRIKESFGIKDCQAQFIHIRIKRFWRRRSRHFNFGNGLDWRRGSLFPILGAGSLDQFRIRSRIRIRIRMDTYMERDQFTGSGNRRRGSQTQPHTPSPNRI